MDLEAFTRTLTPSDAYRSHRTPRTVAAICILVAIMIIGLVIYTLSRAVIALTVAGCCSGAAFALWYMTKPDPEGDDH